MKLYEKYKNDLEALNFIDYCDRNIGSTEEEIEDAIIKIRRWISLQDALNVLRGIYGCKIVDISKELKHKT